MYGLLTDRTAVVTGGSSGIGRAISRRFAEEGADVVVADLRESPRGGGEPTHELIRAETDREAAFVECDVTDPDAFEPVFDRAESFGGVDAMVNNAGIVGPQAPITEIDPEDYRALMSVNLDGVVYGSQAAAERMDDGGTIVNMSSVAGIQGYGGISPYSAPKGGVRLFSYALAADLGPQGVRVNVIHPGVIETTMTTEDSPIVGTEEGEMLKETIPLRSFGEPEDVADVATFLSSELSGYVTAESIIVDGGNANSS